MNSYRPILRHAFKQWPALTIILVLTVLVAAVAALQPWPMKILVDHALGEQAIPTGADSFLKTLGFDASPIVLVGCAAVATLGLFAVNASLDAGLSWCWTAAGQRMVYGLAANLYLRLQRLSLLFHSRRRVGDSLSRLSGDTYCVYTVTQSLLVSPVQHVLTLITVGVVAWKLDPQLMLLSFVASPILVAAAAIFGPRLKRRTKRNLEAGSRLMSFVHQTLSAVPVVQAFGVENRNRDRFEQLADDAVDRSQRGVFLRNTYGLVNGLAMAVGTTIVLFAGGLRVMSGVLTVGSLLVFLAYIRTMQKAFARLLGTYGSLRSVEAKIDRVTEILEAKDIVEDAHDAVPLAARPRGQAGHVRIEGVTFGYETGRPVIQDITLEASAGQTIALVGPTGAGKSTLVSLIPRFFDPWRGLVWIDGHDARRVQLASLRSQIGIVLQEPFLLPLTVAENIAYGRRGAQYRDIVEAAKAANAHAFICRLRRGYDTVVGERGASLSGGEKQRLAVARALLKDAPVLILDEPTSAVDAQTEALFLEALKRLMENRTTFIIAHRLSTIRGADRIVVLDQGRLVEQGSHEQLISAGGLYQSFYELQFPTAQQEVCT